MKVQISETGIKGYNLIWSNIIWLHWLAEIQFWFLCYNWSLTLGGAIAQDIASVFSCRCPTTCPSLSPPPPQSCIPSLLIQVTGWASSTPPQRKLSTAKPLTSSSWDGASWRLPIGWKLPRRTESRVGTLTQSDWVRATNRSSGVVSSLRLL